jgi:hypothetical protein
MMRGVDARKRADWYLALDRLARATREVMMMLSSGNLGRVGPLGDDLFEELRTATHILARVQKTLWPSDLEEMDWAAQLLTPRESKKALLLRLLRETLEGLLLSTHLDAATASPDESTSHSKPN